jgi:bacterial/archaeal transporter family protein
MWILYALLAALAGAILATLTKVGLKSVDHSVALAVQSILILLISWSAVAVRGQLGALGGIEGRTWLLLVLAGVVTSASYLLLYRALEQGEVSRVTPLDRLSLVFAVLLGAVFLKEKVTVQVAFGAALMAAGALLIAVAKK